MARKANIIEKRCTKTGKVYRGTFEQLTEHFYRDKSQKDGLSPWSKVAEREYNKAYYAALKSAKATTKGAVTTPKALKAFEATMKPQRVVRKAKATTPAKKATATRRRQNRQSALKASNSA